MEEYEEYRKLVLNKTLTNLLFTKQDGPHDYRPGIPPAYYFSTIMELDNREKLRFGSDYIVAWKDEEPLIIVTHQNWALPGTLVFKAQRIVALTGDDDGQLTIYLENGTTIAHKSDYGNQLCIEHPT